MTDPKIRKLLVTLHLIFAGLLTPAFLLVAMTGGNYLLGNKGSETKQVLTLKEGASLNFDSETLHEDVVKLLAESGIDHDFEYVKSRGAGKIHLRPTSRAYIEIVQTPSGLKATKLTPSLQKGFMELHKGHGPDLFKKYSIFVAIGLVLVVLGGFLVGFLAPAYRRRTLIATGIGTLIFFVLIFVA